MRKGSFRERERESEMCIEKDNRRRRERVCSERARECGRRMRVRQRMCVERGENENKRKKKKKERENRS